VVWCRFGIRIDLSLQSQGTESTSGECGFGRPLLQTDKRSENFETDCMQADGRVLTPDSKVTSHASEWPLDLDLCCFLASVCFIISFRSLEFHPSPDQSLYCFRLGESLYLFLPLLPKKWLLTIADHVLAAKDETCLNRVLSENIFRTTLKHAS